MLKNKSSVSFFSRRLLMACGILSAFQISFFANELFAQDTTEQDASRRLNTLQPFKAKSLGIIKNIKISLDEKGERVEKGLILAHLKFKKGDVLTSELIQESIQELYKTDLFLFVEITPILDKANVLDTVNVYVLPRFRINEIRFEGNRVFKSGKDGGRSSYIFKEEADVRKKDGEDAHSNDGNALLGSDLLDICKDENVLEGGLLNESNIARAIQKIREEYEVKYPFSLVTYKMQAVEGRKDLCDIVIVIKENLKTRVSKINFIGNKEFTINELKDVMQTKEWAWFFNFEESFFKMIRFSGFTESGYFNKKVFKRDIDNIITLYRNRGYLDAEVVIPDENQLGNAYSSISNDETEGWLPIDIAIYEGKKYSISEIEIKGNKLGDSHKRFSTNVLLSVLNQNSPDEVRTRSESDYDTFCVGDIYADYALDVAIKKIQEYYGEIGYMDCRVITQKIADFEKGTVKVVFSISEGKKTYLNSIILEGNEETRADIIFRELALAPGEVFDMVRMKVSETRIRNLRYFSSVQLTPVATTIDGKKDLKILLTEAPTGSITFGVGFSTVESLNGYVEFIEPNFDILNPENNFQGGGQLFRAKASVGLRSTSLIQSWENPSIFGRQLGIGYDLFHTSNNFISRDYQETRTGARVYLARRIFERIRGELYYKAENCEIDNVDASMPQFVRDEEGYTMLSRGGISFSRDTRNNYLFPNSGSHILLSGELVGGPFGGNCEFVNLSLRAAKWFSLFDSKTHTLKLSGRVSAQHDLNDSYTPFFEKVKYGGAYSLRGFKYGYVAPFEGDEPKGGATGSCFTVEYTLRLIEQFRIALFYDGGFVNEDSFDFTPREYNDDIGFGFRILMPGNSLLNIDFGYPLNTSENNDKGVEFNLSFGTNF